ncbi:MAG: zinc metalloprotease HtpX [Dehalococcoidia bacterium]|nr:zinc metalloprotease HtpX [Dehalococcoidia bacterium]
MSTPFGNTLKTGILLAALTGLLVVIGGAIGGRGGMIFAFVLAVGMNFFAYWFSGDMALKMGGARKIEREEAPWLFDMVAKLARQAGLPMPKVALMDTAAPNAFATGRDPQHAVVAVTTGIVQVLDREELEGVLAHELGHVKNRDILIMSVAATIGGAITMIAQMAQWAMIFGGLGGNRDEEHQGGGMVENLLMIIVAPIAATVIQMAISRAREFGADASGAEINGDPEPLARALEKMEAAAHQIPMHVNPAAAHLFIVNPLAGVSFGSLFSTHPKTADRIARLRAMRVSRSNRLFV